jgi:hypothetical protein
VDAKAQFLEATLGHRQQTATSAGLHAVAALLTTVSAWYTRTCCPSPPLSSSSMAHSLRSNRLPVVGAVALGAYGVLMYLLFALQRVLARGR